MEGTWSGMITIPYDDFVAGVEAIKQIEILKKMITEKYVCQKDIANVIGVDLEE